MVRRAVATDAHMTFSTSLRGLLASLLLLNACGGSSDGASADPSDAASDASARDDTSRTDTSAVDTSATVDGAHDAATTDAPKSDVAIVDDAAKTDGSCVALGYHCSSSPCCDATCDPTSSLCVSPPGGYCDGSALNPDAYCPWGYVCDEGVNKCVKMTCVDEHWMGVCSSLPGLECCDPKTKCTKLSGAGDTCCAPDGTKLPTTESSKCCSASITTTGEPGVVQCIPRPPGP
jgi:hypothetical protein